MRCKYFLLKILLFTAFASGCNKNVNPVAIEADEVKIYNHTNETVYFTAFDRNILALIDWAPTTDPESEDRIDSNRSKVFKLEDVWSYEAEHDIVVYWWMLKRKTDHSGYDVVGFSNQLVSAARIQQQNTTVHINSFNH